MEEKCSCYVFLRITGAIEVTQEINNTGIIPPEAQHAHLPKRPHKTVSSLAYQSLLGLALDSVFKEFPEISAIQTKVYRMLKCHLSIINHSSITQFDDIMLAYHDFDRVAGADFHNVSGSESRPDLSLQTDFNKTYYSMFSQEQ